MAIWKKWVIRVFVSLFVLAGVLFGLLSIALNRLSDDLCETSIFNRVTSPDGRTQAVIFEIDCGATTGFNRQVSIVSSDTDLKEKNPALPKSFFAARGEPEIDLTWLSTERLEVKYPKSAEAFRMESKSKGVAVEYKQTR